MNLNGFVRRFREGRKATNTARALRWGRGTIVAITVVLLNANAAPPADWPMFGQNSANTATNASETTISTSNVSQLSTSWTFTTGGDVSARAAVVNGVVYFPD